MLHLVGIMVVKTAYEFSFLLHDPLYRFMLIIHFTIPPALNNGITTLLFDVEQEECSIMFVWTFCYQVPTFSLTIWSTVFILIYLRFELILWSTSFQYYGMLYTLCIMHAKSQIGRELSGAFQAFDEIEIMFRIKRYATALDSLFEVLHIIKLPIACGGNDQSASEITSGNLLKLKSSHVKESKGNIYDQVAMQWVTVHFWASSWSHAAVLSSCS